LRQINTLWSVSPHLIELVPAVVFELPGEYVLLMDRFGSPKNGSLVGEDGLYVIHTLSLSCKFRCALLESDLRFSSSPGLDTPDYSRSEFETIKRTTELSGYEESFWELAGSEGFLP